MVFLPTERACGEKCAKSEYSLVGINITYFVSGISSSDTLAICEERKKALQGTVEAQLYTLSDCVTERFCGKDEEKCMEATFSNGLVLGQYSK